jgi:hypothetical protein
MAETWRERHHREHWTKRIDISLLFQLQTIAERMKKRAEEGADKELLEWAGQIRLILARTNGEINNIELSKFDMQAPTVTVLKE